MAFVRDALVGANVGLSEDEEPAAGLGAFARAEVLVGVLAEALAEALASVSRESPEDGDDDESEANESGYGAT